MPVALPLVEISVAALLWLCIALALLIVTIMGKLGELIRPVPVVGPHIAGWVHSAAQAITGVLGSAERGIDSAIGASWHLLARFMDEFWHLLVESAQGYAFLAEYIAKLVYAHSGLRTVVHAIEHAVHGIEHGVRDLRREWHGIEHRVRTLEREITTGIGHDLRIGLQKVEKTVSGIVHGTIPALQRTIDGVSGELTQLEQFIKALPGVSYLDWAAGIVAAAVGIDILNALRCPSFLNSLKTRGCGLFSGLESMLGWLVDLFIITDLCEVIPLLETAYSDVAAPAVALLTEAIDATPCVAGNQAPALIVPKLYLPANPGFALSLP